MTEAAAPAIAVTATEAPATTPVDAPVAQATPADTAVAPPDGTVATPDAPPVDDKAWLMRDKFANEIEQAKAYPELLKKMGQNWGAPKDNYVVDGIEGIIKDDPLLEHLTPALKELGLSQNGFANLIKSYQQANVKLGEQIAKAVQTELVEKDALTVTAVDKWITNTFDEAQQKTIRSWIVSVEDFQLLNTLRVQLPQDTSVPSSMNSNIPRFESTKEVENEKIKYRQEISHGLKVADKNFEDALQQRWKDAYTREQMSKRK